MSEGILDINADPYRRSIRKFIEIKLEWYVPVFTLGIE